MSLSATNGCGTPDSKTGTVTVTVPGACVQPTIQQVGSTTTGNWTSGTSLSINKPSGVVVGDIMIVNLSKNSYNTANSIPATSGWNTISSVTLGINTQGQDWARYGAVLYRIVNGSEPASLVFSLGDTYGANGSIIAFSGVSASPFDVIPGSINTGTGTTVDADGITTVTNNAAVIFLGEAGNSTWSGWSGTNPTFAEIMDNNNGNNASVGAAWGIKAIAGSTGSKTATITGNNFNGGVLVALRPATITIPAVNQPASIITCTGAATSAITFGGTGATKYYWTNDRPSIGLAASGEGNIASFPTTNGGTSPVIATIRVTPSNSTCSGDYKEFTITVNPAAVVNQPDNQIVCNGSSTTPVVFGTTNTGGIVTYSWTNSEPAIGLAASGDGNLGAFNAINTGNSPVVATITVTPHFANGSVTCDGTSKSFTITVNPSGIVNQPEDQVLCNGSLTTTIVFGTANTGGTTTYSWTNDKPEIGLSASGDGDIASFTAINLGALPVTATITVTPHFENGTLSCEGLTKSFIITVNPLPAGTLSNTGPICIGENADIIFTATAGTGPFNLEINGITYNSIPSGGIVTGVTPASDAEYTLTSIADVGVTPGCSNIVSTATTVLVYQLPIPVLTSSDNDNTICAGESVTFTASGGMTYEFFIGDVSQGPAGATATFTTSALTDGQVVTVKVSNANDCFATSGGITTTVHPLPAATAGSNSPVCEGTYLNLTASGGTLYSWTGPGFTSSVREPIISGVTLSNSGDYTVLVTDGNGCSASATTAVTVVTPIEVFASSNSPQCAGSVLNLYSTDGGPGATYSWTGPLEDLFPHCRIL